MAELKGELIEFLKLQEKQRQENFERQERRFERLEKQQREDFERQELRFSKLLDSFSKRESDQGSSNSFSQDSVVNSIGEFSYKPDEEVTFAAYFRRYEEIFKNDCKTWTDEKKVRLLLGKFGAIEHEKYANYILPKNPGEISFQETIQLLTKIFGEKSSLFNTRWKCLNLAKKDSEDYTTFASVVNRECEKFKLSELTSDMFKCLIFVQGITAPKDSEIRSRLLSKLEQDPQLTVQKIAEECQRIVNLRHDNAKIEERDISHIHTVKQRPHGKKHTNFSFKINPCFGCGELHLYKYCQFKNKSCRNCGKVGHKGSHCRKKLKENKFKNTVNATTEKTSTTKRKFVDVVIENRKIKFQLDTGSDLTIINKASWERIGSPMLTTSKKIARGVTGEKLKFLGECYVNVTFLEKKMKLKTFVMDRSQNLFGTGWMESFDLWQIPINTFCNSVKGSSTSVDKLKKELKMKFPEIFSEGLGTCLKAKATFELKDNVQPIFRPKRQVPFAALETIDKELDRLEKIGVLSKTDYSSWASPTVYVKKKNNKIRVCADYSTGLNDCLKAYNYPLPSPEEIFAKLNGGKIFSKLDLSEAYLQIPVEENCAKLLTINTHKGLYNFNRLPFGIKVAPGIFQQTMDTMLSDLDFAIAYLDDILIKSESREEHAEHVKTVFKKIKEYGFKLSIEKCEFFLTKIKYLGQVIDEKGRKPDPSRATAITNMPPPTSVSTLQAFLGLASYYSNFIPKMHTLRAPLNQLLKKETKWNWSPECQKAFEQIKKALTSDLSLTHYDPKKEIYVATDASGLGLGAVLLHKEENGQLKAVSHASRTLLPAEKNYSQIEKEALGIIFAVKKYHKYLHGRSFVLQTDHRPLLSIFGSKKGIPTHTANRLQRWATILLNYTFKMEFLPSKKIAHADGLSRLIPKLSEPLEETVIAALSTEMEIKQVLCNTVKELPVTLEEIKFKAKFDKFITEKKKEIMGQINNKSDQDKIFSICDGVLLYGERVVIPSVLKKKILKDFHMGHPGITRMKALMRSYVYWQGMDMDIENVVKCCKGCAKAAKAPPVKYYPWPKTDRPWSRLHIDYAGPINGIYYLIVVDSYSKWPEIIKCKKATSKSTIDFLHEIFARFGIPDTIVSDNGTQFTSKEFENFCKMFSITHMTTAPYHPRSNGQAERFVDTFKRALKKSDGSETEDELLQQFLRVYRITPNPSLNSGMSPAEIMFARKIKSVFDKLIPSKNKNMEKQKVDKKFYQPSENIYYKEYNNGKETWKEGVIDKRIGRLMYTIKHPKWNIKRHYNQIRKRYTSDISNRKEEPMVVMYDLFEIPIPQIEPERRSSKRKRQHTGTLDIEPKRKKYNFHRK